MTDLANKEYVVILQCHIVKERCPGYLCEKAFHERTGGFAEYPKDKPLRCLTITCGGCCGRASHRKLTQFLRTIAKKEGVTQDRIVVQLSSCVAKDNYHAPPCPHLAYVKTLIERIGLDVREGTVIIAKSEQRRQGGTYHR
ncbi:MAG TPA: CGGC domain-containing protein [Sedimentisphaerales bacterium]|nr:CGGC domain-containing protein [Sedimentisphaerales bacterium]